MKRARRFLLRCYKTTEQHIRINIIEHNPKRFNQTLFAVDVVVSENGTMETKMNARSGGGERGGKKRFSNEK